jgi:chitodextrinase
MPATKKRNQSKSRGSSAKTAKTSSRVSTVKNINLGILAIVAGAVILFGGLYALLAWAATPGVGSYPATATIPRLAPYTSFWWQLENTPKVNALATEANPKKHYDFDYEDVSSAQVATMKSQNALVTCYFEVGTAAQWRPDYNKFPASAVSATDPQNWGDERWIDIMDPTVRSIMAGRMDVSKEKGCQGIEPDWLDNYTYSQAEYDASGKVKVPTKAQQLDYMKFLADEAHKRGMMIALKNVPELAREKFADGRVVADVYDWALIEECLVSYKDTCPNLKAFIERGKNVAVAEYNDQVAQAKFTDTFCPQFNTWNFDGYLFDRKNGGSPTLTGKFRVPCRTGEGQPTGPTPTVTVFPGTSTSTPSPTPPTTTVTPSPTPTPGNKAPVGPASLSASVISSTQINLTWPVATDDSTGTLNYTVTRNDKQIYSGPKLSFSDTGLTPATKYNYKVTAKDVGGLVSTGATTSATTQASPTTPPPPTTDTTKPSVPGNVKSKIEFDGLKFAYYTNLTWTASYDNVGVTSYEVRRNNTSLGTTTTTNFKDYNLQPNILYSYDIYAKDAATNSSLPANTKLTGRCFIIWCWGE